MRILGLEIFEEKKQEPVKPPPTGTTGEASGTTIWDRYLGDTQPDPNDYFGKMDSGSCSADQVETMETEDIGLFGLMQTRKLAVVGLDREITGDDAVADFVRDVFSGIPDFAGVIYDALDAIPAGWSVTELVWGRNGERWVIKDLLSRYPGKFVFSHPDWKLRLLTESEPSNGVDVHPHKFAVLTYGEKWGDRYGRALYQKVYWYWYMKKHSVKFWAIFSEKHGMPPVTARKEQGYEGDIGAEGEAKVVNFMKNMRAGSWARLPDGIKIELIEAQRTGSISTYEKFLAYLDKKIAIGVLGQTLTSEAGDVGSYALGKVHELVRQDILAADITMLETWVNDQIIKPLVDYNFQGVTDYPKWRVIQSAPVDKKAMAEVYQILTQAGFKGIPVSHVHDLFGIPIPQDGEEVLQSAQIQNPFNLMEAAREANVRVFQQEIEKLKLSK